MSAVASSPSTPGWASAVTSRSSRSVRLAMAYGLPPAPSAPRAGWSQAMIISLPSWPNGDRRCRVASRRRIRPGSVARTSFSPATVGTNPSVAKRR